LLCCSRSDRCVTPFDPIEGTLSTTNCIINRVEWIALKKKDSVMSKPSFFREVRETEINKQKCVSGLLGLMGLIRPRLNPARARPLSKNEWQHIFSERLMGFLSCMANFFVPGYDIFHTHKSLPTFHCLRLILWYLLELILQNKIQYNYVFVVYLKSIF
jgi:hypothetical protein